ncbi:hypothetical protein ACFQT0_05670 [Hymenobacter humi]|uniref:HMA domain-containing protein n=1 Tax=Hymenobacter humi TaxID=1411620 RepID=A0ABW2U3R1_9BACT
MHCTSCIWLLENLPRLNPGIVEARVQFLRKEITITYLTAETSLKDVVQLLASVGYEPQITLAELGAQPHRAGRTLYYQAGFSRLCLWKRDAPGPARVFLLCGRPAGGVRALFWLPEFGAGAAGAAV